MRSRNGRRHVRSPGSPSVHSVRSIRARPFCRSAIEAAFISVVRRKRLAAGQSHADVEEELKKAGTLNLLAALALFNDLERGGDVMARLNKFGSWAGDVFK